MRQTLGKKSVYNSIVHQLFIDFKKAYDSVTMEVTHNILVEYAIPGKLGELTEMCLNGTYITVSTGKNLSVTCPVQNGLKQ
jgi:hypothetical protein